MVIKTRAFNECDPKLLALCSARAIDEAFRLQGIWRSWTASLVLLTRLGFLRSSPPRTALFMRLTKNDDMVWGSTTTRIPLQIDILEV